MNRDIDPDRHIKRLNMVFGVSKRLQTLAYQRFHSPTGVSKEQQERELIAKSKEMRTARSVVLQPPHRFVLEMVSEHYGLTPDEVEAGILDDDQYVQLLDEFCAAGMRMAIMFFYDEFIYPNLSEFRVVLLVICVSNCTTYILVFGATESGRHVASKKFTKILRVVCSDGSDLQQKGKCVVAYKLSNDKELDIRNCQEVG